MIINIVVIISLLLDGILTNYIPYMVNDLSLYTPLLSIVSLVVIYPYFQKEKKKYLIYAFLLGIVYDLLYTNLLFLDSFIFVLLALVIISIYKCFGFGYIKILISITVIIILYEVFYALILMGFNLVPITFDRVFYKITHSIILNIIYGEIIYILLSIFQKKYLKIPIN